MQVQLEALSRLERRMEVALPTAFIDAKVVERLKRLGRNAKIQGFRPGKAPLKLVKLNYGTQVWQDVIGKEVQQSFDAAVREHKLRVAGQPNFEPVATCDDKENLKFVATFEVYPEVKMSELTGKQVEKPRVSVSEVDVEKTIEILRQQRIRYNRVERAAANGDRVIIDFKGVVDGVPFTGGSSEDFAFVLGHGQMLAEFEAGVVGMKEGDIKSVEVSFPEDYHGKDVAAKTAVFEILMKNVAEAVLPEVDESFAKLLGISDGNVEKMRAEIFKNVEREVKRRLQARIKENVMRVLLESTEIELPKALVSIEVATLIERARQDFQKRGMRFEEGTLPEKMLTQQAERRVALSLILSHVVEVHGLEAHPDEVKAVIIEIAEGYEDPKEMVDWYYASPDRLAGPTAIVLENNVVDFVLSKVTVLERELSFDALMSNNG